MQNFQDIEHFVKTLSDAIKKKIPTKVSQLTNDVGYKTTDTNTTYKLSKSGSTVTLTGSDGSTTSVTDSNTTYSSLKNPYSLDIQNNGTTVASYDGSTAKTANFTNATSSVDGLMSASDKSKLDGVASTYATKGELNDQISSVKTGAIDQIVNLTAAGWTGDAAPYSQTVNVTGMTDELLCELFSACPKSVTVAEREAYNEAFALVASGYAETADGSATFLIDEKPAIDIGVRIKSISKANAISDQTSSDISNAVDAMSNTMWEKIYPVGSIYISANSASPAELFGGTWEQIKDRFLLAAGDNYAVGSTGGEAQHTLTVDEMPEHKHSSDSYQFGYSNIIADKDNYCTWVNRGTIETNTPPTAESGPVRTSFVGGSQPHNNMPPYLAVYMWKRVS